MQRKIKGNHAAMKSGLLAAETIVEALASGDEGGKDLTAYDEKFKASWLYEELYNTRNFTPSMHKLGTFWVVHTRQSIKTSLDGKLPFNFRDDSLDHAQLKLASEAPVINYAKPDGKLSFDRLSSVFLSNTNHEEEQPCHLKLARCDHPNDSEHGKICRACAALLPSWRIRSARNGDGKQFVINAQNCISL